MNILAIVTMKKNKGAINQKFKAHIKEKLKNFDPEHDASILVPFEIWQVPIDIFN